MTADKTLWKLVPVEPTAEMLKAFTAAAKGAAITRDGRSFEDRYQAMLAAAPSPPAALDGEACRAAFERVFGKRPAPERFAPDDPDLDCYDEGWRGFQSGAAWSAALQPSAPAQESEAVTLLREAINPLSGTDDEAIVVFRAWIAKVEAFLARHDQERKS